jgi:hypothetical protein
MSPARRSVRRREWPRGLTERRPGYFSYKHPDGRELAIGRVPLAVAKAEVIAANLHLSEKKPGLLERLTGAGNTIADLLLQMPPAKAKNTASSRKSIDGKISRALGSIHCANLTVAHCADMLERELKAGKARSAQALRSRLVQVCRRGMQLGWLESNPAEVTGQPEVKVKRGRLTLAMFLQIREKAPDVAEWLEQAMMLAIVTGADRATIAGLQRSDHASGYLTITRTKTGARIAIPTALRLECLDVSLAELLAKRTGVVSRYLVHHVIPHGRAPVGSKVHPDRMSHAFTEARQLAGIPDFGADGKKAATFHELRSLAKRLYEEQGNVDTRSLLGHATERMSDLYANPRGVEAIKVRIG